MQLKPSPEYPLLHVQLKLPSVFVHWEFIEHPPLLIEHSSISIYFDGIWEESYDSLLFYIDVYQYNHCLVKNILQYNDN